MRKVKKNKVVVAMSGGVDSSAAALLLKKDYAVTGLFMRLGTDSQENNEAAARAVCRRLEIPFYPVNLSDDFESAVIGYFLKSYQSGLTPNPCIRCNRLVKFGVLLKRARELGGEYLATGHYVRSKKLEVTRLRQGFGGQGSKKCLYKLFRGKDSEKDQSYFLYTLTQNQLKHILFPLGDYKKREVRKIADKAGLPYLKKESQDACFLQDEGKITEHNEFLKKYLKLKPGPIVYLTPGTSPSQERGAKGEVVGKHQGLPLYTVGQRKGVEIGGTGPYYVVKTDYTTNTLYVVKDFDDPALYSIELIAREVNWIAGHVPRLPLKCQAVIRYRHQAEECEVRSKKSEVRSKKIFEYDVKFKEPQRAVTPGQSVVFYNGKEVLGGGIISIKN